MKTIKEALDEAYKNAGSNAYFGNGFKAGVEFAQQMTSFDKEKPEYYTPVIVEYGKLQVIAWLAWSETNGYIWTINGTDVCIRHKPNIKWRHINIK